VASWRKLLWGVALIALLLGIGGAIARGFWGTRDDCQSWASDHNYQLLQNDWWAKNRGCVARTPGGDEIVHNESLGTKARGWAWQFAIFAAGTLPAVVLITTVSLRRSD
jgi:hypothetical protein